VASDLSKIALLCSLDVSGVKKVPLFEYEIPVYRKRPLEDPEDWIETKPTR
jgi:hypothetical protein